MRAGDDVKSEEQKCRSIVLRRANFEKAIQRGPGVEIEYQRHNNIPMYQYHICQPRREEIIEGKARHTSISRSFLLTNWIFHFAQRS